ncbi:MAG: hypothetical protein QOE92_194 [Chloroflexota bacterium]|nr:hypothetical protein [Chloroflexota bacterium]
MTPPEWRWVRIVAVVLLVLTVVPLVVAIAVEPAGTVFGGFVQEARDGVSYVARTTIGLQGHWLYHDPYTSEPHDGSLVYFPYILLGQIDRLLHLPVPVLLNLARLVVGAAMLVAVYRLCADAFAAVGQRRLAFLLVVLGGGIGALTGSHADILGYHYVSLDVGVSGTVGLGVMTVGPHIALAALACAALAIDLTRVEEDHGPLRLLAVLGWTLALALAYPQMAGMWVLVALGYWLLRPRRGTLAAALAMAVVAVPYAAYGLYLRGANPIFAGWPPQADIDVGDPLSYLLFAHLVMLPFAAVAGATALRRLRAGDATIAVRVRALMAMWILVSTIVMYMPGLPTAAHRVFYGSFIPFGILAADGLWRWAGAAASRAWRRRRLLYVATLMCLAGGQAIADAVAIPALHRNDLALYFPADEAAVLGTLRDVDPAGGRVVMNSYLSGLWVPALSGDTTYIGFPFETLDLERKSSEVEVFYNLTDASEIRRVAAGLKVDYVLYGRYERGLSPTDPGARAGWPVLARSGDAVLYAVTR